jgi:class 3 adenylate cyclase
MNPGAAQRKLAAIMFTDMVGYSALARKNEALALEVLAEQQRLLRPLFPRFAGRETERRCQFGAHQVKVIAPFGRDTKCSIGWIGWIGWIGRFWRCFCSWRRRGRPSNGAGFGPSAAASAGQRAGAGRL